ncbi:MAG: VOC family protein [Pseudomonadota bacterium]
MIGYTTLGTNRMPEALAFYDALFALRGASRLMELDTFVLYGASMEEPCVAVVRPYDGNDASVGNGVMVALRTDSQDEVGALYTKALELGGSDEGEPGPRGDGFYAAYFRDLDGNKFCTFCLG